MNNKKIISGAVWIVGLLAVGFGGYWYFSGGAGSGGSVAWSNGVALVESSWDEAVGLPEATSTASTTASGSVADSNADDDGQAADQQLSAPVPAGPPPVYSIADVGSAPVTSSTDDSDSATATAQIVLPTTTPVVSTPSQPSGAPAVVSYSAPDTSSAPSASISPVETVATSTISQPIEPIVASTTPPAETSTPPAPTPTPTQATTTSPSSSSSVSVSVSVSAAAIDHLVIVQVQIAGAASSNDFVKIFNPMGVAVDLTGWKLHKKSSTGADYSLKTFPTGMTIAPGAYVTWANSENGFADSIGADVSSTEMLSADNSVALMDPSEAVIDAVAWGTGTNQYVEGDPYPTDPTAGQILVRKSADGSVVDTDDNANDFTIQ
jgi:hypothetical protein